MFHVFNFLCHNCASCKILQWNLFFPLWRLTDVFSSDTPGHDGKRSTTAAYNFSQWRHKLALLPPGDGCSGGKHSRVGWNPQSESWDTCCTAKVPGNGDTILGLQNLSWLFSPKFNHFNCKLNKLVILIINHWYFSFWGLFIQWLWTYRTKFFCCWIFFCPAMIWYKWYVSNLAMSWI